MERSRVATQNTASRTGIPASTRALVASLPALARESAVARPWLWIMGLGIAVAGAGLFVAILLAASTDAVWTRLIDDRKLTPERLRRIQSALAAAEIDSRIEKNRIEVPVSQLRDALAAVAKSKLMPATEEDLRKELDEFSLQSLFESKSARTERERRKFEDALALRIAELDPRVTSADVQISREEPKGRRLFDEPRILASIFIRTDDQAAIDSRTVEAIVTLLVSRIPGLKPDGITLLDGEKRPYLVAGRPNMTRKAFAQAREDEIAAKLVGKLNWIEGVRVAVASAGGDATAGAESPAQGDSAPAEPAVVMQINRPLARTAPAPAEPGAGETNEHRLNILVNVPRHYYLKMYREGNPQGAPSGEDLKPYQSRLEATVKTTVGYVVSARELGKLVIETIPEPAQEEPAVRAAVEASRDHSAALYAAAIAGSLAIGFLTAWSFGARSRSPSRGSSSAPARAGSSPTEDSGPGPLERVRDLVRLEPIAAAGVMQRWAGMNAAEARS